MTIPVVAASHSLGKTLAMIAGEGGLVDLATNTKITLHHTYNVLCIGHRGDDDQRVLVGAHLDSVPAGLGLVDNASGSATLLEILLVLNTHHPKYHPRNKIVFAWWGAEEVGLLGSRHYVRSLSPEERSKIALNLNFDMLASPNGVPFIHNGTDAPLVIRNASLQLQRGFEQFFHRKGRPYEITDMVIGSDFLPFLEGGIPAVRVSIWGWIMMHINLAKVVCVSFGNRRSPYWRWGAQNRRAEAYVWRIREHTNGSVLP
ncbi:LOW QUALITY PROTEIN: hypothetical protein BC938DRAFT_478385, partial [Jimgerdemannia flammicorona]